AGVLPRRPRRSSPSARAGEGSPRTRAGGTDRLPPAEPACPSSPWKSPADREREAERRSPAFLGLAPDPAVELLDDQAHQVETQPRSLGFDRVNVVGPVELLEQPGPGALRNADAAVGDGPPGRRARPAAQRDRDDA